jgi:hypothetical protein
MLLSNNGAGKNIAGVTHSDPKPGLGRTRLARELFSGGFGRESLCKLKELPRSMA